jgi:hypothetical protein
MLHVDDITGHVEHGPFAPDVHRLIKVVAAWAFERPLLQDVSLFGQRIRPGHNGAHPLVCAVRFDDVRMNDGFDDWIEQLRTRFGDLAKALGEPVTVVTPDMRSAWLGIVHGTEVRALASDKVRIITVPAPGPAEGVGQPTTDRPTTAGHWPALWQVIAGHFASRRPAI